MPFIVAISGKKQSGKNTLSDYLISYFKDQEKIVKQYSFADDLKDFLVKTMGLRHEQVWGTDEEKNSLTEYLWETLPLRVRWENSGSPGENFLRNFEGVHSILAVGGKEKAWAAFVKAHTNTIMYNIRKGPMTGRELMQVFGTDIMRKMFNDRIWVNATFRNIQRDNPDVAIIPDMRFPSEVHALVENNGCIIRLTRDGGVGGDTHSSETALDDFDWNPLQKSSQVRILPPDLNIEEARVAAVNYMNWLGYNSPEMFESINNE